MRNDRFQRYQKPVYTCAICGRRTRLTGQHNDSLCRECEELAMLQNFIFDQCGTVADIAAERDEWLNKAVKLGSDPERIKSQFPELWPKETNSLPPVS